MRGNTFKLSWLKDICIVTANRKGTLYFRSGDDRYQMPLETYAKHVALPAPPTGDAPTEKK